MSVHEQCILIGGYAQPPRELAVTHAFNILSCQLLINKKSHCIVQCHFNLPSQLSSDFIEDLVMGHCMDDDFEPLAQRIRQHLHLVITSSVIHALRNAHERYREIDMKIWT